MNNTTLICLNGTFIPREDASIVINDGSFLFGDTLFETFKAYDQKILLKHEHLDRLETAARYLDFPFKRDQIETSLIQIADGLTAPVSRLRLTLSRGAFSGLSWPSSDNANYLLTATACNELNDEERATGVSCVSAPNQRVNSLSHLPQMKRGNYADCLYAYNHAQQSGAREALFFDLEQNVLEGSTTNIFAIVNDRLVTPKAGKLVLDGIMRQQVIDAAAELGILVIERPLPLDELLSSEEIFLTNSLIDILPVAYIDEYQIKRGNSWQRLLQTLRLRITT
jgi:branched-chain amino acid aminotransferase